MNDDELLQRAIKAFQRSTKTQASEDLSTVLGNVVTLRNVDGYLATYRLTRGGRFERLTVGAA